MRQLGMSLVELMVAIALSTFLALIATTYYVAVVDASRTLTENARSREQLDTVASFLVQEVRRAGYRGSPSSLASYLASTGNSDGTPSEGTFPAVDISTAGCILGSVAKTHSCAGSDHLSFAQCDNGSGGLASGTSVDLHYRFGVRLTSGVVEAVSVVHPSQYDAVGASAPSDSACGATGGTSAWQALSDIDDIYIDTLTFTKHAETIYDGDTGCELGVGSDCLSNTYADCGDSISCRIERIYKIELCGYQGSSDSQCVPSFSGSQPEGQISLRMFASPRNDVLISKDYSS